MSPVILGFIRAIGTVVLMAVLTYLGNQANLNGVVDTGLAAIISGIALAIEHSIEAKTGKALFGAVATK